MATKASAPAAVIAGDLIPRWDQWVVPKDPNDVSSRAMFTPWKLTLDKEGMFKCKHKGSPETLLTKKLEVIFLVALPYVECRCTKKNDALGTVLCESHNRVISKSGFYCKTECPFAEPGVKAEDKENRRPLGKTALILYREEGKDSAFKLGRYISSLDNIDALNRLKDTLRQQLVANNDPNPYPSAHSAVITCAKEQIAGGKGTIGTLSTDVEIGSTLDESAVAAISALNEGIVRWYDQKDKDKTARAEKTRQIRLASGGSAASAVSQQTTIPGTGEAPKVASGSAYAQHTPTSASVGSEDNLGDTILGEDDDSLDW